MPYREFFNAIICTKNIPVSQRFEKMCIVMRGYPVKKQLCGFSHRVFFVNKYTGEETLIGDVKDNSKYKRDYSEYVYVSYDFDFSAIPKHKFISYKDYWDVFQIIIVGKINKKFGTHFIACYTSEAERLKKKSYYIGSAHKFHISKFKLTGLRKKNEKKQVEKKKEDKIVEEIYNEKQNITVLKYETDFHIIGGRKTVKLEEL
jgi:hypothetical protein